MVRQGRASQGRARQGRMKARLGTAWQGPARRGTARQGEGKEQSNITEKFMTTDAKHHPLDIQALNKGDYITPTECEDITGLSRNDTQYQFRMQAIREWVYRESKRNGLPLSCGIVNGGLKIHTDAEAAEYHRQMQYEAIAKVRRSARRMVETVNRSKLTDGQAQSYDREVALAAMRCQSLRNVGKLPADEKQKEIAG